MTRPVRGEARSAILEVADRLFYRDGVRAVGVDLIAAEAGITKRTLYYHFPTKDALIDAYLLWRDEPTRALLTHGAEQYGSLPGDHVLGIFDVYAAVFTDSQWRGCAYLNAVAESGSKAEAVRGRIAAHKDAVCAWIATKLHEAGAKDPQSLAEQLMVLVDGAIIRSTIYPNGAVAAQARAVAAILLRTAGVPLSAPGSP